MSNHDENLVYTTARHYRYMIFVENTISPKILTEIFHDNLKIWGGRYTPIIPMVKGKISPAYKELIKECDPDVIFYADTVDIAEIEKLNFFHPKSYVKLAERRNHFGGVDYHYLLSDANRDFLFYNQRLPILHIQGEYRIDLKAKEFYQTNFALFDLYFNQDQLIKEFAVIPITKDNHTEINKIIHEKTPYFKSILSQLKLNTRILTPEDYQDSESFELIISDSTISNDDLFYFWNRQQYIENSRRLYQIIVNKDDLTILLEDPYFEGVLLDLQFNAHILLVSYTVSPKELEQIRDTIQKKFRRIAFKTKSTKAFPFQISKYILRNDLEKTKEIQVFTTKGDLLKLRPPFLNERTQVKGVFVYDLEVQESNNGANNKIKYPLNFPFYENRVNKSHNQSIFATEELTSVRFSIPTSQSIFEQRVLRYRTHDEKTTETSVLSLRLSNAGQRMSSLIKLFQNDWSGMMSLLDNKFWFDLFRYDSEFTQKESNIPGGRGIFCYKDLREELRLLYTKYDHAIPSKLHRTVSAEELPEIIAKFIEGDLEDVDYDLQSLIDLGALYIGLKAKCDTCGSNKWYSLKECQDRMPCKGCNSIVIPQRESPLYYKINEIIVNNLLSDIIGNKKDFHGNYVVIRAINYLRNHSRESFNYWFPLDYSKHIARKEQWASDIDILALQDGKLIIGEAKASAGDFNKLEIDNLIWLANNVKPDKIMLAYCSGEIDEIKIQRLRNEIIDKNCDIIKYKPDETFYMRGGLSGFPHKPIKPNKSDDKETKTLDAAN